MTLTEGVGAVVDAATGAADSSFVLTQPLTP